MSEIFEPVPESDYLPEEREILLPSGPVRCWRYPGITRGPLQDAAGEPSPQTALLVHGFRGDHHGLALIAGHLRARRDVVVPDLPGFGRSEPLARQPHDSEAYARTLTELAEHLGGKHDAAHAPFLHLIGHSYGSVIAARMASQRPDLFSSLGLINPIAEPALDSAQRWPALAASAFYRTCALLPRPLGWALVRSRLVTRISSELMMKNDDPQLRRYINGQHDSYFGSFANHQVVMQSYADSIRRTVAECAAEIHVPTLLIAGARDELGSPAAQQRLRAQFPAPARAHLELLPQVGHLIHYEAPRRAAALLESHAAAAERRA